MASSSQAANKGTFTVVGTKLSEITRFVETGNNIAATDNTIDVSHLGLTGTSTITIAALPDPNATGGAATEYQIDYMDLALFKVGQNAAGQTVTAASLTLSVNDVPRGSVTVSIG